MIKADSTRPEAPVGSPLAGLRVLDFTHVFAGPFGTRNIADLGADVVHVESHGRDPGDRYRSAYAHRNKRSISLDLKSEAGHTLAKRLAAVADVVAENFSADVMHRLRLDYDSLRAANPQLIYISLSGYGHTGPRRTWTSMNLNLQAYTGLLLTTGSPDDPPTSIANPWNDYIGGIHGSIAILQALAEKARTGQGRYIDLSQFECSVATLGHLLMAASATGRPPARRGNRSPNATPQGVYPCAGTDEWCAIVIENDAQWSAFAAVVGSELTEDIRFASATGRLEHHDELDAKIGAWTRGQSPREIEQRLQPLGIPCERMRRADDVVTSPDGARGYRALPDERKPPVLTPTLPFSFSRNTIEPVSPPRELGADTSDVLREWLELDEAAIALLEEQGAFA